MKNSSNLNKHLQLTPIPHHCTHTHQKNEELQKWSLFEASKWCMQFEAFFLLIALGFLIRFEKYYVQLAIILVHSNLGNYRLSAISAEFLQRSSLWDIPPYPAYLPVTRNADGKRKFGLNIISWLNLLPKIQLPPNNEQINRWVNG